MAQDTVLYFFICNSSVKFRVIEMTILDDHAYFKKKARWFRIKTIGLIWCEGGDLNPHVI